MRRFWVSALMPSVFPSITPSTGEFESIASHNGLFHIALAVAVAALYALITGAISLRTRGVHFIMITMSFGQMVFFAIVSIETYGGDDGLTIYERSSLPVISLDDALTLYAVCYVSLLPRFTSSIAS